MATALWARSAAGTNLTFAKGLGKLLSSWREIIQSVLPRKYVPKKPTAKIWDGSTSNAKDKCRYQFRAFPVQGQNKSLSTQIFNSVFSRTMTRTMASELRRQAALRLSSSSAKNFRNMPIMSLIGVSLGVNLSPAMDDGAEHMMTELRENFRSYQWKTEPLEKIPTCLDDLHINEKSIANGCEGAVYKAKVKGNADNPIGSTPSEASFADRDYDLAVKAVFNYGAESNAHSILCELEREVVPLRPEGCQLDTPLGQRVGRLPPHPNIVDMPGIFVDDMLVTEEGLKNFPAAMPHRLDPERFYGHNKTLYLVMRRRNGHLREFLEAGDVAMTTRCQLLAQLLEGVAHLAQHGVIHRDLKADNILVDVPEHGGCPRIEICDFGCCLAEEDNSVKIAYPSRDMYLGGNSWLMAPEISTAKPGPSSVLDYSKSDLWAVGALAYEILGGENPFYPSRDKSRRQLDSRDYKEKELPPLSDQVPVAVRRLVKSLLARDPEKRPSARVAAAVVQLVALASSHTPGQASRVTRGKGQANKVSKVNRQTPTYLANPVRRQFVRHSWVTTGRRVVDFQTELPRSLVASTKERECLNWILLQGLALVCQLTFNDQSKPWDTTSVMSFLLFHRLTFEDFKKAMCYF